MINLYLTTGRSCHPKWFTTPLIASVIIFFLVEHQGSLQEPTARIEVLAICPTYHQGSSETWLEFVRLRDSSHPLCAKCNSSPFPRQESGTISSMTLRLSHKHRRCRISNYLGRHRSASIVCLLPLHELDIQILWNYNGCYWNSCNQHSFNFLSRPKQTDALVFGHDSHWRAPISGSITYLSSLILE